MMNAKEARFKAERNTTKYTILDVFNEVIISFKINLAVIKKKKYIIVHMLRDNVAEKLKEKGYKLEIITTVPMFAASKVNEKGKKISSIVKKEYIKGYKINW